jgi:hypothetical protein
LSPGGNWVEEFQLSDAQYRGISTGCVGGHIGILGSIAVAEGASHSTVVASYGANGVLLREDDGRWVSKRVLSAGPFGNMASGKVGFFAMLLFGPILAIAMLLFGRRRWPSWRRGLAVIGTGWLITITALGVIGFLAGPDINPAHLIGRAAIAGAVVTAIAATVVARRPLPSAAAGPGPLIPNRPDRG